MHLGRHWQCRPREPHEPAHRPPPRAPQVLEIVSATELKGRVLNAKSLGARKNVNLPGGRGAGPLQVFRVSDLITKTGLRGLGIAVSGCSTCRALGYFAWG